MAVLKASKRSELGSRKIRLLRKKGKIPGVIYGHGEPNISITLDEHDIGLAVHHGERLIEVDVDGEKLNVLIKDVQYDTFGQDILHVDLTRVSLDERVKVTVPIVLRGTPVGAVENGVLRQITTEVNIESLVTSIPEEIRLSVVDMNIGDQLFIRDLPLPENTSVLDEPDTPVCVVNVVLEADEAPTVEEEAQPEVIGEKEEAQSQDQDTSEKK